MFVVLPTGTELLLTGRLMKGVAVGCGWQATVAYINIGCYYFIGIPLGVLLGFKFDFGIKVVLISDEHAVTF